MPTRELLSSAQRAQLLTLPTEMSEQMLARYYTLSDEDRRLIKQRRRNHNRLGFAVQLAYLRFPGRTWAANEAPSPLVVSSVASQLKLNPMPITIRIVGLSWSRHHINDREEPSPIMPCLADRLRLANASLERL